MQILSHVSIICRHFVQYFFRITYKNKIFGRDLTDRDIRTLLEGGSIKNKNGDSAILDVDYEYFVRIDYKEKKEDRDF